MAVKKAAAKKSPAKRSASGTKISGRVMGSAKAITDAAKRGSGENQWVKNIPTDGITVRFLSEPEDWVGYMRYWSDEANSYIPMLEGERAPDGARSQFRFVASAVDIDNDRVVPLDIPKTIVTQIMKFYGKYDTLLDRDYDLGREGEKLDTTYTIVPDSAQKRNLKKYEPIDLLELLLNIRESALNPLDAEDEEDDDDEVDEDYYDEEEDEEEEEEDEDTDDEEEDEDEDDEEEEEDEEDEDEVERLDEAALAKMTPAKLRDLAEYWEVDPIPRAKAKLVEAIVEAQNAYFDDDDADEAEDEDDDDLEELDENALSAMSVRELRALAEEYEVDHAGLKKAELVEAILESAE